jgi:hypothetical protein
MSKKLHVFLIIHVLAGSRTQLFATDQNFHLTSSQVYYATGSPVDANPYKSC